MLDNFTTAYDYLITSIQVEKALGEGNEVSDVSFS